MRLDGRQRKEIQTNERSTSLGEGGDFQSEEVRQPEKRQTGRNENRVYHQLERRLTRGGRAPACNGGYIKFSSEGGGEAEQTKSLRKEEETKKKPGIKLSSSKNKKVQGRK